MKIKLKSYQDQLNELDNHAKDQKYLEEINELKTQRNLIMTKLNEESKKLDETLKSHSIEIDEILEDMKIKVGLWLDKHDTVGNSIKNCLEHLDQNLTLKETLHSKVI